MKPMAAATAADTVTVARTLVRTERSPHHARRGRGAPAVGCCSIDDSDMALLSSDGRRGGSGMGLADGPSLVPGETPAPGCNHHNQADATTIGRAPRRLKHFSGASLHSLHAFEELTGDRLSDISESPSRHCFPAADIDPGKGTRPCGRLVRTAS